MSLYRHEHLTREHFSELGPLMVDAFGAAVSPDLFAWKYLQNPAGEAVGKIARAEDGSLAAFYGMIPELYRFDGEVVQVYQSCDTMTHSNHRRRGLFQKLALETYAEAQERDPAFFAFGFSGSMSTPGFVKMHWRIEEEIPHLFRPSLLARLKGRQGNARLLAATDPAVVAAMERLAPKGDGLVRSAEYLAWRLANPQRQYEALLTPSAYAVFVRDAKLTFLVDFAEEAPGSGASLLRSLDLLSAQQGGKGLLTWTQPTSPMGQALKRYGYLRNPFSRGPASHRVPLISYGPFPHNTPMRSFAISPLDHDSL